MTIGLCTSASEAVAKTMANLKLQDQFDQTHHIRFPSAKIRILTIADKKGSEQIEAWVNAVKQRYQERVEVLGVADVRRVPRPLRALVQRAFKKQLPHPIMLDWSGAVPEALASHKNQANIYVLNRDGQILIHMSGIATEPALAKIFTMIDQLLRNAVEP